MDSDEGKVFLGGISWDTSEERINDYFSKYGVVSQTVIMRDKITGRPRGFGFVVFSDPSVIDNVVNDTHNIDGRNVQLASNAEVATPAFPKRGEGFMLFEYMWQWAQTLWISRAKARKPSLSQKNPPIVEN
ncbi:heterogeneous nuclear ribonucleoprotein 1-like protein [Tanacetum coccineum]